MLCSSGTAAGVAVRSDPIRDEIGGRASSNVTELDRQTPSGRLSGPTGPGCASPSSPGGPARLSRSPVWPGLPGTRQDRDEEEANLVDEYVDRGESARSADRPALKAMLARIAEARDVDAVVVHKIDRLARNMEDHVAIRALLRRRGVALVSVTENVEETASGRLVEGIHALMAEFYSANLAAEIKKGLSEKAKQGGFPHGAPLGYVNLREVIAGHQVARIVPDPERAPLVSFAFESYATGEWTLQRLAGELAHRGLTGRARRDRDPKAVTWQGLAKILANPPTSASSSGTVSSTLAPTNRSWPSRPSAGSRNCLPPARRAARGSASIRIT
jgi:DNA invertase Pin-like site-specific DNA recombinase